MGLPKRRGEENTKRAFRSSDMDRSMYLRRVRYVTHLRREQLFYLLDGFAQLQRKVTNN